MLCGVYQSIVKLYTQDVTDEEEKSVFFWGG
jgi:hypothetical protein